MTERFVGCRAYYRRTQPGGLIRVFFRMLGGYTSWIEVDRETSKLFRSGKYYTIEITS